MTKSTIAITFSIAAILGALTIFGQSRNAQNAIAILGVWTNPQKDAKFEIYEKDNKYFGKIIWGTGRDTKDSKNPDPKLRGRDLVGLIILNNFVYDGKNTWVDGTIYDPQDGKTYSCKLTLTSPNKLDVRGYLGISLFGRTETWTKIN
ncbi:MAG: DUF2147 domain-containing protein [Schleiferiaceae bacterium]|nr:DUF2147 domain-containing protein [Schleiferiaceae bacterium]